MFGVVVLEVSCGTGGVMLVGVTDALLHLVTVADLTGFTVQVVGRLSGDGLVVGV